MKFKKIFYLIGLWFVFLFKCRFTKLEQNVNKYLVYECKHHCGGWADRIKGFSFFIIYIMALNNIIYRKYFENKKWN